MRSGRLLVCDPARPAHFASTKPSVISYIMSADAYPTDLLDRAICREREAREQARREMLCRINEALVSVQVPVGDVYLFGSVVTPGRFGDSSDIDIAIHRTEPRPYFDLKIHLERRLGREVDLVELESCSFAVSIIRKGILWKHPFSPSSTRE